MQGKLSLQEYEDAEPEFPSCLVCKGVITNPVCSGCLEKEALAWLSGVNPGMKALLSPPVLFSSSHPSVSCILCSSGVNVCAHCYCSEISRLLSNNPDLGREFLCMFNFELSR
ncbi:hypothetical protein HYU15_02750 [Candidatus Woesearchaeota archaeon]|nr:hypothetical protein [Candidatus Woesearchaeota archaeon]